jgi:hypothetical protein
MHLRLGFEGVELMRHRRLTLSVAELRAVGSGRIELSEALRLIEHAEERLRTLVEACSQAADIDGINRLMVRAHIEHGRSPPVGRMERKFCQSGAC